MKNHISVFMVLSLLLAGCASYSSSIKAKEVDGSRYQSMNCSELHHALTAHKSALAQLSEKQGDAASSDRFGVPLSILLKSGGIFPSFMTGDHEEDIAALKGHIRVVRNQLRVKRCF